MAVQKTNITLAVESDIISTIKQEAQTNNTSVNARVNRILSNYADFARYFTQKPFILTPKVFEYLLENVDEKVWLDSWDMILAEITSQISHRKNTDFTIDILINRLIGNVGLIIGAFDRFTLEGDDPKHLVFTHKYGIKWSRILACTFSNLLESKFECITEHQVSSNTVRITINR